MNTEVEYNIPPAIPGDPPTRIVVDWSISFDALREGAGVTPIVTGIPCEIRAEIGGEPFRKICPASLCSPTLKDWLVAREADLSPDVIGMTAEECLAQFYEEEDERRYLDSQIGRPI